MELFINHFTQQANQELGRNVKSIAKDAKAILLKYDWPGNLRELGNVIKRMVLLSPTEEAKTLQLWVFPDKEEVTPRYEQKSFDIENQINTFVNIVSPKNKNEKINCSFFSNSIKSSNQCKNQNASIV